jgi:osmoprotectant transport system substrate-binding protein
MRFGKSYLTLALALLFVLSTLLVACGDTATPAATTTTAAAVATTAPAATTTTAASSGNKPKVVVGSKNFTEDILVAEMYAQALEAAGIPVDRKLDLGSVDIAQAAITKGDISIYPEYTGTALLNVLKGKATSNDPKVVYDAVVQGYQNQFKLTVLDACPMNDSNGIVVSKAVAQKYNLKTLSDLSKVADQLTFAAIADFVGPRSDTDGLGSLQKTYGGFKFKTINQVDIKIKYEALRQGQADAAVAFTTDGEIAGYGFVLMADDKNNFPPYQMIPVVRPDILAAYPNMKDIINKVSAVITTDKISALNWQVDGPTKRDTTDVAKEYLKAQGIIK